MALGVQTRRTAMDDFATTEELYGKNFDKRYLLMQKEVCEAKIEAAMKRLLFLLQFPLEKRDHKAITKIEKAIDYNEKLLKDTERALAGHKDIKHSSIILKFQECMSEKGKLAKHNSFLQQELKNIRESFEEFKCSLKR